MAAPVILRWTPLAIDHLESVHEYVAADSPAAANEVVDRILSAAETLARYPQLGRPGRVEATRELVVTGTPFIVAYRMRRNQIQILAVLHGAQRWPDQFPASC
jgi:plasmid stabilization system protein ParE